MKTDYSNTFSIIILGPIFIIPAVAILILLGMLQKEETN